MCQTRASRPARRNSQRARRAWNGWVTSQTARAGASSAAAKRGVLGGRARAILEPEGGVRHAVRGERRHASASAAPLPVAAATIGAPPGVVQRGGRAYALGDHLGQRAVGAQRRAEHDDGVEPRERIADRERRAERARQRRDHGASIRSGASATTYASTATAATSSASSCGSTLSSVSAVGVVVVEVGRAVDVEPDLRDAAGLHRLDVGAGVIARAHAVAPSGASRLAMVGASRATSAVARVGRARATVEAARREPAAVGLEREHGLARARPCAPPRSPCRRAARSPRW